MNNNEDIEIFDDFGFDDDNTSLEPIQDNLVNENITNIQTNNNIVLEPIQNNLVNENVIDDQNNNINNKIEEKEPEIISDSNTQTNETKEELENPVVEMINNKKTMKLILVMLIVLFIAVFFMPKFFELIKG